MNPAAIEAAMETLEPGAVHYIAECPRCRRVNKVSVKQMRREISRVPQPPTQPSEEEKE